MTQLTSLGKAAVDFADRTHAYYLKEGFTNKFLYLANFAGFAVTGVGAAIQECLSETKKEKKLSK
jgi:hypothetical protein